jgi:hypothetical protein
MSWAHSASLQVKIQLNHADWRADWRVGSRLSKMPGAVPDSWSS